jgi:transglutaminase-like putative cysteine protease
LSEETLLARLKRVNARQPPETDMRVRVCVLLAVVTAALAVVEQGVGSTAFRVLVVGGLPIAYWYSWRTRHQEGFWLKAMVALGACLALGWFLRTITLQAGGTFADVQVPLAQLLLLVQVLHGFDVPGRRDLLFSLLASLALMAVAGVLSVSMALVPYLIVWGVAAVSALVFAHGSQLAELPSLASAGDPPMRRRREPRLVVGVVTFTLAIGLGLFLVVPPAGTARVLLFPAQLLHFLPLPAPGELSNPSLGANDPAASAPGFSGEAKAGRSSPRAAFGYFGFSTSLDLAIRGRPNATLVMRVRADRPALWRGQTFDVWNGRKWTMSNQQSQVLTAPLPIVVPPPEETSLRPADGPGLVQTYYVAKPGPNLIFGAAPITSLYFPDRQVYELSDGTLRAGTEVGRGAVYTVISRPPAVTAADLRHADVDGARTPVAITQRYAAPPIITPRVRDLARQVTASAGTTYDKVVALEAWMAANTRYTLNVPRLPEGADAVDQFLFVDHRGFCEQIATSLVVMLRSLGVPARVVAGYAPGLRNPFTGLFEVRASDAHLWTEAWFPGVGWQSFDPTAVVPLAGDFHGSQAGAGLGAYLAHYFAGVPGWLVIVLAAAAGAALIGMHFAAMRRARKQRPRPSWAEHCLTRLEKVGAARGHPRRPSETVYEYAATLERAGPPNKQLDELAALISRAAFSGQGLPDDQRQWAEHVLDELATSKR